MKILLTVSEMMNNGNWESYCDDRGVNEDFLDFEYELILTIDEAEKYGVLKGIFRA